jgi:hypothetical protein
LVFFFFLGGFLFLGEGCFVVGGRACGCAS